MDEVNNSEETMADVFNTLTEKQKTVVYAMLACAVDNATNSNRPLEMDEYFCPHCGTILNEQSGFAPSCGTWTCTKCGKHLMDDDVYEGDTFQGVAWYCDNCNALLNRQSDFSDRYGTWTCTKCGHVNGTTEDDIRMPRDEIRTR